jgi:nucleotide-binding universal stress UspA family protein
MSMHAARAGRVVVAVGSSPACSAALRWAAAESLRRGTVLDAVHVVERGSWPVHEERRAALESARQQIPDRVARALGWGYADVDVSVRVVCGPLLDGILQHARHAGLLVVGRPSAAAHRNLPGRLAERSACPVIVIDEAGEAARARPAATARPA